MLCVPTPAVKGLKAFPDTPGPPKLPPDGLPVNKTFPLLIQTGAYIPALTIGKGFTMILTDALFVQPLAFV